MSTLNLEQLIVEGDSFSFLNNSQVSGTGRYGRASDSLLSWAANVEEFIRENYGENSGPYRLYSDFERDKLTGHYESDFNRQLTILKGAIKACQTIKPKQKTKLESSSDIVNLIKNRYYYISLVVLLGAAFSLGMYFGSSKFDKEKSEYFEENKELKINIAQKNREVLKKDSTIAIIESENLKLKEGKKVVSNSNR